jgi:hypothetical protein
MGSAFYSYARKYGKWRANEQLAGMARLTPLDAKSAWATHKKKPFRKLQIRQTGNRACF